MKNEKYKKSLTTRKQEQNALLLFFVAIWKRIHFAQKNNSLGKCSLYYYISGKVFFSVAGYLKQSNETPTSIYYLHWSCS